MKKPFAATLFAIALATPLAVPAQSAPADGTDLKALHASAKTSASKRALVESTLALTDAEAKKFWPVYDTFQRKLDAVNRRYSLTVQELVLRDRPISDDYARRLARTLTEIEDAHTRARKSLYASVVRALPGGKAVRYLQIESKLDAAYRYEIASAMSLAR